MADVATNLTLAIENKYEVPLPAPEGSGEESAAEGKEGNDDGAVSGSTGLEEGKGEAKEEDACGGAEDGEGPTDEELALLQPPRREVHNVLFRIDMSGINAAANFVKRAEVKDFLDIFFVVSRLLGEEWTVWTQHAALVYLHNDRWKIVDTHVHLDKTVHVMRLRMLSHDGYHREFGGEGNFDFILEEVAKIKAARQAEMEIKLTHEEKLRLVWGGELPKTPYDMHKALERLWRWEFDEKIAEKDKHRERVEKRRQARLKLESNKGSARVTQVRKVHREANRLAMEQVEQQQGVIEKMTLKHQAAEVRREVAAVERTTEWHPVRLRPHKPPMEPVPGITPGGPDEDNEAAVTEDVFVYFTPADPVDDSELGETWIMDKVEERLALHPETPDEALFFHICTRPGFVCGGATMQWILPAIDIKAWVAREQLRLQNWKSVAPPNEFDDGDEDPELLAQIAAAQEHVKSHGNEDKKEGGGSRPASKESERKEGRSRPASKEGEKKEGDSRPASKGGLKKDGAAEEKGDHRGHTERYNIPLRLCGFAIGQDSMEWVREYRIRISQQDWSRKLSDVIKARDALDPKKAAVPRRYMFVYHEEALEPEV